MPDMTDAAVEDRNTEGVCMARTLVFALAKVAVLRASKLLWHSGLGGRMREESEEIEEAVVDCCLSVVLLVLVVEGELTGCFCPPALKSLRIQPKVSQFNGLVGWC